MTTLEDRYRQRNPRSLELYERHRSTTPGGVAKGAYYYNPFPLTMERGEGCYLWDVDGHRYVDFVNHHTGQVLGNNHPAVVEAVKQQMERGIAVGAPMGVEKELCAELCRRVKTIERVRFCNSGTEATLHAVRLARGFSGRPKIAKFEGCYHGSHDAVEISVAPPLEQAGPAEEPAAVVQTGGMSPHAVEEIVILPLNDIDNTERLIARHRDELACVLLEPKAGILDIPGKFIQAVREITRKNDVLLIFDEIVAFRVGMGGAQEYYGIDPDLTAFGKIVGGGFPVGAFGGRADLMDMFDPTAGKGMGQSGTFSAHPLTMAAGLAMLRELTPEAYDHLNGLGDRLSGGLNEMFERNGIDAVALNTGSVFSVYFTSNGKPGSYRDLGGVDKSMAHPIFLALLEQGYFLGFGLGMCAVSLPTEAGHVDGLVNAFESAVEVVKSEQRP